MVVQHESPKTMHLTTKGTRCSGLTFLKESEEDPQGQAQPAVSTMSEEDGEENQTEQTGCEESRRIEKREETFPHEHITRHKMQREST